MLLYGRFFVAIAIKCVPKIFSLDASNISFLTLSAKIGEPTLKTVKIDDRDTISSIVEKMNRVYFSFDFEKSSGKRIGFMKYYVKVYDKNNQLLYDLNVCDVYVRDGKDNTHWTKQSENAQIAYQYLDELFGDRYVEQQ